MTSLPLPVDAAPPEDPRFVAGVDLLRRTGALEFQMRWTEEDNPPTVWVAVVRHNVGEDGKPRPDDETGRESWETAAALTPTLAVLRLAERLVDGGTCAHCQKPTMFYADVDDGSSMLDPLFCIYEWDPELGVYRRGCEGDG